MVGRVVIARLPRYAALGGLSIGCGFGKKGQAPFTGATALRGASHKRCLSPFPQRERWACLLRRDAHTMRLLTVSMQLSGVRSRSPAGQGKNPRNIQPFGWDAARFFQNRLRRARFLPCASLASVGRSVILRGSRGRARLASVAQPAEQLICNQQVVGSVSGELAVKSRCFLGAGTWFSFRCRA